MRLKFGRERDPDLLVLPIPYAYPPGSHSIVFDSSAAFDPLVFENVGDGRAGDCPNRNPKSRLAMLEPAACSLALVEFDLELDLEEGIL